MYVLEAGQLSSSQMWWVIEEQERYKFKQLNGLAVCLVKVQRLKEKGIYLSGLRTLQLSSWGLNIIKNKNDMY